MAKPIPINRRWLQNRQAQQAQSGSAEQARQDDLEAVVALVREYLGNEPLVADPIIPARYEGQCVACGEPIRVGNQITRHPLWGVWVHAACRNQQQRALTRYTIPARYPGICRYCRQAINLGERITRHARYGWIHDACAQQLSNDR